jgi:hypothetical protein
MAKKESKIEAPKYQMPHVEMGDIVLWHAAPDEPAVCAAVVTEVCNEGICISLLHRNMYNMEPKDGVRHKDHPDRALIFSTEAGCWSEKPSRLAEDGRVRDIEALFIAGPAIEV